MHSEQSASIEHVDVLIVGAGISGTGAAYYLKTMQPWSAVVTIAGVGVGTTKATLSVSAFIASCMTIVSVVPSQ